MSGFGCWPEADAVAQAGSDPALVWHPCDLCDAAYRSRRAALACCGDRFADLDLPPIEADDATDDDVRQALEASL